MSLQELSPAHSKFVDFYLDTGNAKDSAIRAGYSINSAKNIGYSLLQRQDVRAELAARKRERVLDLGISEQKILEELYKIATANIQDFTDILENGGSLLDIRRELAAGITEYEKTNARVKIKFGDKLRAIELLGKHLGMFKEKVEHEVTLTLEQLVTKSFETSNQPKPLEIESKPVQEAIDVNSNRED